MDQNDIKARLKEVDKLQAGAKEDIEFKKQQIELMEAGIAHHPLKKSVLDMSYKELYKMEAKFAIGVELTEAVRRITRE